MNKKYILLATLLISMPFLMGMILVHGNVALFSGGACSGGLTGEQGSTVTTTGTANSEGEMYYTRMVASETGYANTAIIRTQYGGATEDIWVAVYDSAGNLIAETEAFDTSDPAADVSNSLDAQECIENSSTYYLAFQGSSGAVFYVFRDTDSGNNIWKVTNTFTNGPPATINPSTDGTDYTDSVFNCRLSYE